MKPGLFNNFIENLTTAMEARYVKFTDQEQNMIVDILIEFCVRLARYTYKGEKYIEIVMNFQVSLLLFMRVSRQLNQSYNILRIQTVWSKKNLVNLVKKYSMQGICRKITELFNQSEQKQIAIELLVRIIEAELLVGNKKNEGLEACFHIITEQKDQIQGFIEMMKKISLEKCMQELIETLRDLGKN